MKRHSPSIAPSILYRAHSIQGFDCTASVRYSDVGAIGIADEDRKIPNNRLDERELCFIANEP